MSECEGHPTEIVDVDVRAWVETARPDPQLYRDRQVTEVVLAAIGLAPTLKECLVLKGGTLMAIAFKSDRVTGDVDFSAMAKPDGFEDLLRDELDKTLPKAAIQLGYLNLLCRVQSVRKRPKPDLFEDAEFPALEIKVASAQKGTSQERLLSEGKAARTLVMEVSFRDQVYAFQELHLINANVAVQAFTLEELIAEKLRALLQQPLRDRHRRQDVFDIAYLLDRHDPDAAMRVTVYETLIDKCRTRGIAPVRSSIDDPEVRERAERDWETLRLELSDLPPFDERFGAVSEFYRSLPWPPE